jgi:phosphoheptose isomerase
MRSAFPANSFPPQQHRDSWPEIALTTGTSALTAIGND